MNKIILENRTINLIAEIGWNHMGNMDLAEKMIIEASNSGANFCKFQTWSEKKLKKGPWDDDGRRDIYKKAQLTQEQHYKLKDICKKNSVNFLTSVFNSNDLDFLRKLDKNIIKVPSHEIQNIELISNAIKSFEKVLISTGASKWNEIEKIKKNFNLDKVILMHCVSSYPCNTSNINLPRILKLQMLSNEVGYSGHFFGIDDALASICLGATYVEKHFTIDRDLPGRDNKFALLPSDFKKISNFRDNFVEMNKFKGFDLQDCEIDTYQNYRGRWSK